MKIEKGLVFTGKHFTGRVEVLSVDEKENTIKVDLKTQAGTAVVNWSEDWNLEHTQWGFEGGVYTTSDVPELI